MLIHKIVNYFLKQYLYISTFHSRKQIQWLYRNVIDRTFLSVYCAVQERGENIPPEDSFEVARKVKETHCYTCSDIVKVIFASIRILS